jgi:para-aminobenzoate synthetase component 1
VPPADRVAAALLGRLPREVDAAAVRQGRDTLVLAGPDDWFVADGMLALDGLGTLAPGLWVGWCAYELGHTVEAVVPRGASGDTQAVPDVCFARFGATARVTADGRVTVDGDGRGRAVLERAARDLGDASAGAWRRPAPSLAAGAWRSSLDRDAFEDRVGEVLERLRAGECYQVNLTRRLTVEEPLDPVDLYAALAARHPAPHAGMARFSIGGRLLSLVCASPERFLRQRGRDLETRPIKGTSHDPVALAASEKDRAENVMIVDLARNDLGRVCEPGSVTVPSLCAVESHPGLHHLVSTVRGRVAPGVGRAALLAATLPPASVTGAPKPRVLQIVEDLEPVRRGVYCGAFGWIDTRTERADLAVAIRTFTVFDDRTELGVGAGIVADSSPRGEWEETELKAARLLAVAGAGADVGIGALVPS